MAGTITSLEVQEHNHERVNVYLDGLFGFGLTEIEAAKLRKGQTLSDAEITSLKARDEVQQAYEKGLRLLGQRPRSAAEIRRHLTAKKIHATVIDEALDRLEAQGYVNDLEFARFWISNRQQFKPLGARALSFELREKGIDSAIIAQALEGLEVDETAYRAATDKAKRLANLDPRAFREKLTNYMMRRGFNYDTVRTVIERLISERGERIEGDEDADTDTFD